MNITTANLKLFYQRRGMWFWYAFFISFLGVPGVLIPTIMIRGAGAFAVYLFFSFFLGFLVADLHKGNLAKPFAFCLPGYRIAMKKLIIGIGCTSNLLLGTIFIWYPGLDFPHLLLVIPAAGFLGITAYFLGVWIIFLSQYSMALGGFLPMIIFFVAVQGYLKPIEDMIVSFPILMLITGALTCVGAWKWLGSEALSRKYCGESFVGFAELWDLTKREELRRKKAVQRLEKKGRSSDSDRMAEFLISLMKRSRPLSASRYVLGCLRFSFGRIFGPWWRLSAFSIILVVPFLGYMAGAGMNAGAVIFLSSAIVAVYADFIPYPGLLLPGGRREKYWSVLVSGIAITLLATVLVTGLALLSFPLSEVMPDIIFRGNAYAFEAFDMRTFYLCPLLMPIALVVGMLFSRKNSVRFGSTVLVMMLMQVWINPNFNRSFDPTSLLGVPGIIALIAVSWIGFIVIMGYHCRKRNLVGQRR